MEDSVKYTGEGIVRLESFSGQTLYCVRGKCSYDAKMMEVMYRSEKQISGRIKR